MEIKERWLETQENDPNIGKNLYERSIAEGTWSLKGTKILSNVKQS